MGGGRARRGIEQSHLAEEITWIESRQDDVYVAPDMLADYDSSLLHDVQHIGVVELAKDHLPALDRPGHQPRSKDRQSLIVKVLQECHLVEELRNGLRG